MPEAVVDALEPVHVNEDQPVNLAVELRAPQRLIEALNQQPPVRQAGEAVVKSVMVQLVLERLALGYVAERDDGAGRRSVVHYGGHRVRDRDRAAVLAAEPGVI